MNEDRPTVDLGPLQIKGDAPPDERGDGGGGGDDDDGGDGGGDGTDFGADLGSPDDGPPPGGDIATRTSARPVDPIHNLATQQLARRAGTEMPSQATRHSTVTSPVEAMRLDEIARTQVFLKVAMGTSVMAVVAALTSGGDPIAFRVVMLGCLVTLVGCAWMYTVTLDPTRYTPSRMLPSALVVAVGAYAGVYYWGPASPATALMVYGLYFFSLGGSARMTFAVYLVLSLLQLALALPILFGWIHDRGIVQVPPHTLDQVTALCIVEFLYFITFFTARVSQRVTLENVSRLEQAVRGVAQREALLAEARAELDRALKVGGPGRFTEQVVGTFRLGVLIGRGGMGEVYEAHGVGDQREAAVKLLHPGTLAEPTHVARFVREGEMVARLDCPNIVRVLEVGTTAGEIPFIAMERLRGHDLAHQLRRQRRMQLPQTLALVEQIAIGLEAARAARIVHRDLKPHNLFAAEAPDGRHIWKILDFGVSKAGGTGTLTKGHVVGTPAYMAPEQARGEDVDHRADVYSLAAIIYRCVTGHPAFTGKDVPTTLYDVVYRVPTQPSILAPLPADIDRVLALGLAKVPADRLATADELARWFALAVGEGLAADQRRRADDLIHRSPWGTRLGSAVGS